MKHYDYIFAGSGLAALMTVYRMATNAHFAGRKVLLIDPARKDRNDRTWCYWAGGPTAWDSIAHRQWNTALFASDTYRRNLNFGPYRYYMVRGIDFYEHVLAEIQRHSGIHIVQQQVVSYQDNGQQVTVNTNIEQYTTAKLFNSIYDPHLPAAQTKFPVLRQHFIGWHVKTSHPVFDPEVPTFMDFSVPQKGNTRFMYVLPFAKDEAIVEYTLFSEHLLPNEEYEHAIEDYLVQLRAGGFTILDTETGSIPMTSFPFWQQNTRNILHIGSAGGWTKASTGYTFRNADKLSQRLVGFLEEDSDLTKFHSRNRFWYYDLLLLDILYRDNARGASIFSSMFKNGNASCVFRFLDEETSMLQDLQVILACPKPPFLAALARRLFHL